MELSDIILSLVGLITAITGGTGGGGNRDSGVVVIRYKYQ